jgi:hypothetical protein
MHIAGTSLTTTSKAFLENGKRHIVVRCFCGSEAKVLYHNLGKCTSSCGCQAHRLSPSELKITLAAAELRGRVAPRKTKKPLRECTPEERVAHREYLSRSANVGDVEKQARALAGKVPPHLYSGPVSCATPEQLAGHWKYVENKRR